MVRKTKQKMAILKVLQETCSHPDAFWIYEQVKKEIPNISLGTVYRNLRLLQEYGLIRELNSHSHLGHFDGNTDPHYHFHCDRCGQIIDIEGPVDKTIEKRLAERTGYKVTRHSLELGGECADCLRRAKKEKIAGSSIKNFKGEKNEQIDQGHSD